MTRLGLWDGQHAIRPPERASQRLSMEPQCPVGHGDGLEIMDQGLTDGPWLVAFWLFFTHSSQAFLGSPLSCCRSLRWRPPRVAPVAPIAYPRRRSAHPLFSSSSHPRPCQTLLSPPVGLSFLIQPPTDCRQPPTGHRHPETRSAPFPDISLSPSAPLDASFSFSSQKSLRCARVSECLLAFCDVRLANVSCQVTP